MNVNIILARSVNGVIGKDNKLPWHLPEDLQRFKELTKGDAVIMGRKTWESLPEKFRPLPDRTNIVLTTTSYTVGSILKYNGALVAKTLREALNLAQTEHETVWIIGGENVYRQAIHIADAAFITEIDEIYEGDTFCPEFGMDKWIYHLEGCHVSKNGLKYKYIAYTKRFQ